MKADSIVVITPCFNENTTVISFLREIENAVQLLPEKFEVVVVDDCSSDNTLSLLNEFAFMSPLLSLTILPLKFNVGHQAAIYQGLLYSREIDSNKFIIMDADGEDDPAAISELINTEGYDIVHIARGQRKESISFKVAYYIYRILFRAITGKSLNFGNYCMINKRVLETSCYTSFIHFAAHLSKQKVSSTRIVYDRLKRIDGKSKMNFTSLIHHAFKSFVEYAEELLMIFLKIFMLIIISFLGLIAVVLYKKLFTNDAILGWASTMTVGLFTTAVVCLGFFVIGILLQNMISRRIQNKKAIFEKMALK